MGKTFNALVMSGAVIAGAGSLAACGGAETYGPGSVLTAEGQCADSVNTTKFVHEGQGAAYAVDDLTVDETLFGSEMADVDDQLSVRAVGVENDGEDEVTEIVVKNPDLYNDATIEIISGLPYDQTLLGKRGEIRVDLQDLRDREADIKDKDAEQHVMEVRENGRKVTVTIGALANGGVVTVEQDCGVFAKVDD